MRLDQDYMYNTGGSVNKWLLFCTLVATGLWVRTETITLTDMDRSAGLIPAPLHYENVDARLEDPLGGNKTPQSESSYLSTDPILTIVISTLVGGLQMQIYRSGLGIEEIEIHFRIVSRWEECTFTVGDLAPLPIGLNEIGLCLKGSFGSQ